MTRFITRRSTLGLLAGTLISPLPSSAALAQSKLKAIASFTILADLVRQVGGDQVEVTSLIGPNRDAHSFEPSPADARRVAGADLVVINGIGFEEWADKLVRAAGYRGGRCVASAGIKAISSGGGADPHAWQDPANVRIYVQNIAAALIKVLPAQAAQFEVRAQRYTSRLERLDNEIRGLIGPIPRARRKVITSHQAFAYFGDAYDVDFLAPKGASSHSEAAPRDVSALIRQIREENIRAIFIENMNDPRMINQIARETGARVSGTLYADALPPGRGGYIEMMQHNARTIARAMA